MGNLVVGLKVNFKNQKERLVYRGPIADPTGFWHQFAKVEEPDVIWAEVRTHELDLLEVSNG